jgi:putative transposase
MLHFSLQMTLTPEYNRKVAIHSSCFINNHLCKGAMYILKRVLNSLKLRLTSDFQWLHSHLTRWTKPLNTSLVLGTVSDLFRSTSQLVAENALVRQQLIILRRQVKRPGCSKTDRKVLVLLARAVQTWKQALFIIQPETLLRWHREGFRLCWKRKAKLTSHKPKVALETISLIKTMAKNNRRLLSRTRPR